MSTGPRHSGRRGLYLAAATTAVLASLGIGLLIAGRPRSGPPQPPTITAAAPKQPATTTTTGPTASSPSASAPAAGTFEADLGPVLPASAPVSLDIVSIDVHTTKLVPLAYAKDGALEVPRDFDRAGWFTPGPTPGQFGPAVIAGHVDSTTGPAVFYRLGALKPGATVTVGRQDGSMATFVVDKVERYAKDQFPRSKLYGNTTNRAELRLITCGGRFDQATGHYRDNIVAYAHLTA